MAEWRYNIVDGGLLTFDGVQRDGKKLVSVSVDKSSDNRVAVATYEDGHTYTVRATHSKDGDVETLTNISEVWT